MQTHTPIKPQISLFYFIFNFIHSLFITFLSVHVCWFIFSLLLLFFVSFIPFACRVGCCCCCFFNISIPIPISIFYVSNVHLAVGAPQRSRMSCLIALANSRVNHKHKFVLTMCKHNLEHAHTQAKLKYHTHTHPPFLLPVKSTLWWAMGPYAQRTNKAALGDNNFVVIIMFLCLSPRIMENVSISLTLRLFINNNQSIFM